MVLLNVCKHVLWKCRKIIWKIEKATKIEKRAGNGQISFFLVQSPNQADIFFARTRHLPFTVYIDWVNGQNLSSKICFLKKQKKFRHPKTDITFWLPLYGTGPQTWMISFSLVMKCYSIRGKKILEQLSRPRFFPAFEISRPFSPPV